jgi:pyridoxamine-phosphate oxidase
MANNIRASSDTLRVLPHVQYHTDGSLSPSNVAPDPLEQFRIWFTEASAKVSEPEAMTLSTATASGIPSARTVLFKLVDSTGFVFFTNYTSRKSGELLENPNAALVFYWKELHKQVRVLGRVEKLNKEDNEEYFHTRPVGSQLGAWASKQSTVIEEGEIEQQLEKYKQRFHVNEGDPSSVQIPAPDFWGGWRVVPHEVEFWMGKPSRLHDRVVYKRSGDSQPNWSINRLSP